MNSRKKDSVSAEGTHLQKVLFPKSGITKGDLLEYYKKIAPYMLRLIRGHLLTQQRYPKGIAGDGFYQKNSPPSCPVWIHTKRVKKLDGGWVRYVIADNQATLLYLVNQYCVTFHVWLSGVQKIHYPDRMIFDLDPSPGVTFAAVRKAATHLKALLEGLGFVPFVMLTGSRGVHVVVPLKPVATFDEVYDFAQQIAAHMASQYPQQYTIELRKAKRGKRIFIDALRNTEGATAVAPYAVRAYEGAPVAAPLLWEELLSGKIGPRDVTIDTVWNLLKKRGDPWKGFRRSARPLSKSLMKRLHFCP